MVHGARCAGFNRALPASLPPSPPFNLPPPPPPAGVPHHPLHRKHHQARLHHRGHSARLRNKDDHARRGRLGHRRVGHLHLLPRKGKVQVEKASTPSQRESTSRKGVYSLAKGKHKAPKPGTGGNRRCEAPCGRVRPGTGWWLTRPARSVPVVFPPRARRTCTPMQPLPGRVRWGTRRPSLQTEQPRHAVTELNNSSKKEHRNRARRHTAACYQKHPPRRPWASRAALVPMPPVAVSSMGSCSSLLRHRPCAEGDGVRVVCGP
eukprot:scaffold29871_cov121-Isochrysis_galbana.AAC.2